MSLARLKEQAAQLPSAERKELIGFLLSQARSARENEERAEMFRRKIDDKDPSRWVDLEEVEKRYGK